MSNKTPQQVVVELTVSYEEFVAKVNEVLAKNKALGESALQKVENRKVQSLLNQIKS
jgi:hypothetical protein